MKLTPEKIAEIQHAGDNDNPILDCEVKALLDHIRAVEKERNDWRDVATRLADELRDYDDSIATMQDFDALIARHDDGKPEARTWKAFAAITNGRLGDVRERASAIVAYAGDERIAVTVTEVVG